MEPLVVAARLLSTRQRKERCYAPTIVRLLTSNHLEDLQLAAIFALVVATIDSYAIIRMLLKSTDLLSALTAERSYPTLLVGIIGAMGLILSWAYQAGSKRLGAIDMVATEISAICRVCAVTEFPDACLKQNDTYKRNSSPPPNIPFTISEEYAPFFDHNAADIQLLSFDVIKSVTSFYTYRKTMLDLLRKMHAQHSNEERETVSLMMIYNQYLMYEIARYAIAELIEYDCERAESLINILCCEMVLYPFLVNAFKAKVNQRDDVRYQRLILRRPEYNEFVADIQKKAENASDDWRRARATLDALEDKFGALNATMPYNQAASILQLAA